MKKTTGIFVDLGFYERTKVVILKSDRIVEVREYPPSTEFPDIVGKVFDLMIENELQSHELRAVAHPAFEQAIHQQFKRNGRI